MHSCVHAADINNFYNQLVSVLNCSAAHSIPVIRCNSSKPYWSGELQQLKEDSVQANKAWLACGKPRQGWLNSLRLHTKYKYKIAIMRPYHLNGTLMMSYLRLIGRKIWTNFGEKMATAIC